VASWAQEEDVSFPLGVTWVAEAQAYNFALYSKHAEQVTLLLYRADDLVTPAFTYRLDYLKNKSGRIWHCRRPAAALRGSSTMPTPSLDPGRTAVSNGIPSTHKRS
jgi:glycogen operon protein